MCVSANTHMSLPQQVKTVLALTFFDEQDRRAEFNHWQYWYNLQANPNQRAFDIGMYAGGCDCEWTRKLFERGNIRGYYLD